MKFSEDNGKQTSKTISVEGKILIHDSEEAERFIYKTRTLKKKTFSSKVNFIKVER
jgi:hypothetical protein